MKVDRALDDQLPTSCQICGTTRSLDRHHILHRKMGGSKDPVIHDHANLITLCRRCHTSLHDGPWQLTRLPDGIRVVDKHTGEQVMRRRWNPDLDVPALFNLLSVVDGSLTHLVTVVPYLNDDQLVEAFAAALTFGKRGWLIQASILYEAQQRSIYGDGSLAAIARRFEISLRQAQKYALVWKVFFAKTDNGEGYEGSETNGQVSQEENVNIDAIVLDDPSWYVIAASESPDPEAWLGYAQDRKLEDPRYTVAALRRDIRRGRHVERRARADQDQPWLDEARSPRWDCPWIRAYCTKSGRPVPVDQCAGCEADDHRSRCERDATTPATPEEARR